MLSRVSSVSTQTFKLDPQNSTSSSPGQTIRVSLPSNTLLNLKSIKMLANVTLGGSGARLPPKINSLIDRVTLECGGVTIKSQDVDLCEGMPLIAHRRWEEKDLKNSARGTIVSVKFNHHGEDELVIALDRTGALVEMATSDFHFARVAQSVDIIFLDEPGFLGEDEFRFLLQLKTKWPQTRHIYAGEFHQLGPVDDELLHINKHLSGDYMHSAPMTYLVDKRRMELKTYQRGDAQLGQICCELRQAVIDRTIDKVDPLLFPVRVETDVNISYVHRIRKKIIAERMANFIRTRRYSVHLPANPKDDKSQDVDLCEGMPLIAHRRWEQKDLKNSARGTIVSVSSFTGGNGTDELVISLDRTGELIEMQTSDFHRYWRPAFCITVHQSQCITINQPYTIYGWNHEHMLGPEGPRGRYVAVSRGTKMEHVQICLEKGYDR